MNIGEIEVDSMQKMDKLLYLSKQCGIWHAVWRVIKYILRNGLGISWKKSLLLERVLAEPIQIVKPKLEIYNIRQVTIADLEKFKGIIDEAKYERFKQRFAKGKICFAALRKNKIVAFNWISFNSEFESVMQVEIQPGDKEAYLFDAYVETPHRNKKLHSSLIPHLLKYLRDKGYEKIIVITEQNNIPALKTLAFAGYKPRKTVTLIRIFGFNIHRWRKLE